MEFEDPRRGKKRKGGVKQRMARAAEEMSRESALEVLLMTYLAQGLISGAVAHSIAQAAATDLQHAREGYSFPALERLASLAQGRNLIRQVYNQLEKSSSLPNVFTCDIPYKGGIHPGSILLPHELLRISLTIRIFGNRVSYQTKQNLKSFGENLMGTRS